MKRIWGVVACAVVLTVGCEATEVTPPEPALDQGVDGSNMPDQGVDAAGDMEGLGDMPIAPDLGLDQGIDQAVDAAPPVDMALSPDMAPDMAPLPPCADLRIEPGRAWARAFDLVTFRAVNASDGRRFELIENNSGAILNSETGAYLAGERSGVADLVRLTDPSCVGEVRAQVQVVNGMVVQPTNVSIEALGRFTFQVEGGSGQFDYAIVENQSGAAVDPRSGLYVSGDRLGQDLVQVTDLGTGQMVEVFVSVVDEVRMQARPPELFMPIGASHPLEVLGGSGQVDVEVIDSAEGARIDIEDGMLRAVAPGWIRYRLSDRFFDLDTTFEVTVVDSLQPTLTRGGDGSSWTVFHAPGDLNNDGFDDAIVGYSEVDLNSADSGGVYLYHGGPEGLEPTPVQVFSGDQRRDFFGRSVTTGDIDGDGLPELVVSAYLANIGALDSGAVYIYQGLADGRFSEEPVQVIGGRQNGDHAGRGMALCDLNGDDRLDLVIGAWLGEDRTLGAAGSNQGTLSVHLGYEEGLLERPDQLILGVWPDENGELRPQANQRLGMFVSAGDFDGDGLCDIAAGTTQLGRVPGEGGNDGMVFIYKGQLPDGITNGGLTQLPVRIISRGLDERTGRQLGRRMAVGDIDADGLDDLLLSRYLDPLPEGGNNAGSVWVFRGAPMDPDPATEVTAVTEADWVARGNQANDQFSIGVNTGDVNGDGVDDLLVGAWFDELVGQPTTGTVQVFYGVRDGLPATEPDRVLAPRDPVAEAGRLMGEDVVVLGDVDGDGAADILSTLARDDTLGWDVGQWFVFPSGASENAYPLEMPANSGGQRFGHGVAIGPDVTGDGLPDAIAGAPHQGFANSGLTGKAWIFPSTRTGFEIEPVATVEGWPNHSGFDRVGWAVGGVGDFDGDGIDDWAVAARDDETQAENANFGYVGNCIRNNGTGTIYIFRGQAEGIATRPTWAVQGRRTNALMHMIGHADVNGDGRSDLIGGAPFSDPNGGDSGEVIVVLGRAAPADDRIQVLCDPVLRFLGGSGSTNLGRAVVGLGDLNGDGCEEFAFGAPRDDIDGINNQGAVRVVYGWGGQGCPAEPTGVVMSAAEGSSDVGWSLAAAQLDGDRLPDLVVGAPNHLVNGARRGGVWVVPGSYINSLARRPIEDTRAQADRFDPRGAIWVIEGRVSGERFGTAVGAAQGVIGVGSPLGDYSGVPFVGGARFYGVNAQGINPEPIAALVGQTWRPEGRLGEAMHMVGGRGRAAVIVGGFDANGPRVEGDTMADPGGAYGFILSRPRR